MVPTSRQSLVDFDLISGFVHSVELSDQLPSVDQGCRNERDDDMSQTSSLARQVTLDEAWSSSEHSEICCLIYATQNGWKLPILFEEIGVPYDWALVDF